MLVEFRVKNFRSLRDEQVLSLVASKDKTLRDTHTQTTGICAVPTLVRSAVIYGANASGKSNLIKALQYMRGVVTESATAIQPGQAFAVQPFLLDANAASQPSEFEITFLLDGVRYQYGFAMTAQRIVAEYLLVYKAFKPQRWFTRYFDSDTGKDVYDFGPGLKGPKNLWEGATRPNSLFLSMAVQLNSETLRPVFDWFMNRLVIFNEQAQLNPQFSIQMLKQADGRKEICNFLSSADISIADIDVETRKVPGQAIHFDLVAGKTEVRTEEMEEHRLRFHHVTEQGKAVFELMNESNGTRNLLFLAGSGDTDAMLQLIEEYNHADLQRCWAWVYLSRLVGTDLTQDAHYAINEDGSDYDDDVGGPAYVAGRDGLDLEPLDPAQDAAARLAAQKLFEQIE